MWNVTCLILSIAVAIWAIISGFKRGITIQLGSFLGFAFGMVASRLLTPDFIQHFQWVEGLVKEPEFKEIAKYLVCSVVIYAVVYIFFSLFNLIFKKILIFIPVGIFNRLVGSFFTLVNNLLWLSIFFNLILAFSSSGFLLRYEKADDGNLIAGIMEMTPAILGCQGGRDFAHIYQLKEAKFISHNFNEPRNVIIRQG